MNKERNCQACIHHISGLCSKWDCEMQTLEEYKDKAIKEFAEKVVEQLEECQANYTQRRANNEYEEGLYDGCEHAIELLKAGGK